jgi:hypothetical protein
VHPLTILPAEITCPMNRWNGSEGPPICIFVKNRRVHFIFNTFSKVPFELPQAIVSKIQIAKLFLSGAEQGVDCSYSLKD